MLESNSAASGMQEALRLAHEAAAAGEVPVGAVVMLEGKIVGRGRNRREADQDPVAHAEVLAIREAAQHLESWRLLDCTLIVTLEPCPMCLAACQQARVREVIYGTPDPKGGAVSLGYTLHDDARLNHRFKLGLDKNAECETVLKDFFQARRKK